MIPKPVATVVGEQIGAHYYSHREINLLFWEAGAKGDPPPGSCSKKIRSWLLQLSNDTTSDDLTILGKVLQDYMEVDRSYGYEPGQQEAGRERIRHIMAQYGLSYHQGGRVVGGGLGVPTRSLEALLRKRDLNVLNVEFERALSTIEIDPPAALTASCAILESLCKIYIETEQLFPPSKETIKPLWAVVQKDLKLDPAAIQEQDFARILSGLTSIIDGIGSIRTHAGSAHGHGQKTYRIQPRHARLAANAAHTLATFLLETWDVRKADKGKT